jgi:hypothetical protein
MRPPACLGIFEVARSEPTPLRYVCKHLLIVQWASPQARRPRKASPKSVILSPALASSNHMRRDGRDLFPGATIHSDLPELFRFRSHASDRHPPTGYASG